MPPKKQTINTMNKQKRIPRPIGTTELSKLYNDKQITKEELNKHIISHYINTDYRLNNIKLNLEQFSLITGITTEEVLPYIMNKQKLQYNFLDDDDKQRLYGELSSMILMGSLKDRLALEQHTTLLLESQGASYKPFISSEVTKALKLLIDSNNSMLQVHQRFFGQSAPTITINNNNVQNTLSVSEAQMLIQSNKDVRPLLEDPEAKEQLYLQHNLSSMPEINANKQQGIDTSREGLNFNKVLQDNNQVLGHIDRRADEYQIDLEADEV